MLKVVIADDEDVIRGGLINFIDWNKIGYEFIGEASNGKEAAELIHSVKPDVFLTDIKMPFLDGLTLVDDMKKEYPDLYIIILSGHDEFEYARRALAAGVYEFLLKPIQINNLISVLTKIKEDYDKREEARDEFKKLKEIEQEGKLQIQNKIYRAILIDNVPLRELQDSLSLLSRSTEDNFYVAGVVEMQNLVMRTLESDYLELTEIDREFGDRVERIMKHIDSCFLYKSGNCERILCLQASNSQILQKQMNEISNNIRNQLDEQFPIVLSYGSVNQGLEGLRSSYMESRSTLEKIYNQNWTNVLYPENPASKPLTLMNFDTRALVSEVQTGSKSGIDTELQIFEATLKSEGITSFMMLIMIVSDIYFQIIKLPEGVEPNSSEVLKNPAQYYHKIVSQKDIPGILYHLKKVCYEVNDFYAELNKGKFTGVCKRVAEYMNANYSKENLMIKEVAQHAFVSTSYLSVILKKELGVTFIEYLTKIRMEKAKKFLDETQMRQYEVAEACGYSNPTYFSTIFKRYYGVSPSGYLSNKAK